MILYLSSVMKDDLFARLVREGGISGGHQAQKFNSLVVLGLAKQREVVAISNPPYNRNVPTANTVSSITNGSVKYISISPNFSRFHKIKNYFEMNKYIKQVIRQKLPYAVVCDAINPLASMHAIRISRKFRVPVIAIVTDIPQYMDAKKITLFTKLTSKLLENYDGYVLLTEAMNELVNPKKKPMIVMEGLCDSTNDTDVDIIQKQKIVFYSGSLSKGTGIENLLEAFKRLETIGWELHIYGNGECLELVKSYAKEVSSIKYRGIEPNNIIVQRQKEASLLINPRPSDIQYGNVSFPSKIMEYLVSGTPVLTTKLPGIPHEYFDFMYTIDDCSVEGILAALQKTIEIPVEERAQKGREAHKFAVEKKSYLMQTQRIMQLIKEIRKE